MPGGPWGSDGCGHAVTVQFLGNDLPVSCLRPRGHDGLHRTFRGLRIKDWEHLMVTQFSWPDEDVKSDDA